MSGFSLNVGSTLSCPHGGQVTAVPSNSSIGFGFAPVVVAMDTFTIAGCPFTLPGPTPSPCIQVRWIVPDTRVRVNGSPTLSQSSVGLCLSPAGVPQGAVIVASTQSNVQSQ